VGIPGTGIPGTAYLIPTITFCGQAADVHVEPVEKDKYYYICDAKAN
jgi:hypothetical protein